ncbi:MAG TPA: hypothetical protein VMZ53_23720 [Kofleriaceae bacterium]|nr:hypothetical protein [Kofleriaceae bacterium]
MKASKFIVLVGGILGILAFFLPLVSVERQGHKASVSAFQVMKGLDQAEASVDEGVQQSAFSADTGASAKKDIGAIKGIVMAVFAPALLLVLIGGLGVARKKFGRVAGTFSFLLGLLGLGIGAILKAAAEGDGGIGLTFLLLTGFAGVVGGLATLIKPERGASPAQSQFATVPAVAPRMAA